MTMVSSGPISLGGNATTGGLNQSINIELGQSATATISLNDANVRTLLAKTGAGTTISLSDAYGKSNVFAFTISTNQTNANLRTLAVNAGWDQSSAVQATINGGIIISSNSTGTPALTVNGSFPGGVTLINNGVIVGMGGAGGTGAAPSAGGTGGSGGLALSVSSAITINNASGTIAGGGGGGGGGAGLASTFKGSTSYGGGGGGGGGRSSNAANSSGGAPGSTSGQFSNGGPFSGAAGTYSSAGSGGGGGVSWSVSTNQSSGAGGAGGNWGSAGSIGATSTTNAVARGSGGAGGGAVAGNSNITWTAFGTRTGGIT